MSVLRKVAIAVVAIVVVAAVVSAGLALVLVRRPLPAHDGAATLDGLAAEVTVVRDERGIPQIYAASDADLMRAQGYVHAQDRFFEMDYRRHVTAGRLSELVGANEAALAADQVVRTMGWRRVAEQEWELLSDETQALYAAYADGVNAYLDGREASRLGVEYTVLGMQTTLRDVEPWQPVDSIAWLKAMAWDLSANYEEELGRATALRPLGGDVARVEELYPDYPYDLNAPIVPTAPENPAAGTPAAPASAGPASAEPASAEPASAEPASAEPASAEPAAAVMDARGAVQALARTADHLAAVPVLVGEGPYAGSNSFAVAAEHTGTGAPLLANDPHLGLTAPSVWYQVGLHCTEQTPQCTFDVSGFSFSGLPGVVIGHNAGLAWGLTNLPVDAMDLTLERIYEDGTYLRDGARVPLEMRRETIEVNDGDAVTLSVASTEHGPIVSEVLPGTGVAGTVPVPEGAPPAGFSGYAVALQWTALQPGRSAEAIFALDRATGPDDVAAAAALLAAPAQNILYATADGDIGSQAAGRTPVRAAVPDTPVPADGSWPRPGWDSRYDWQGDVAPVTMPAVRNPAEGYLVAANQAAMPAGQGPFLTNDWDAGYRAERVRELLAQRVGAGDAVDVDAANAIMVDDASPFGPALVPSLLQVDVDDDFVAEAVDELRSWSAEGFPTATDSAGAAYFNAVWTAVLQLTFADDLPSSQTPDGGSRWLRVVELLLEDPQNPWWDDRTTVNIVEGRDEILRQALVTARQQLTNSMGKNPADWEWGQIHQLRLEHPVLGGDTVPDLVRRLVNPAPVPVAGGSSVVNAMGYDAAARDALGRTDFSVTAGPSMRMVVDLADPDASTWVAGPGSSGHPGSPHYTDQMRAWAQGATFPWPFTRAAVDETRSDAMTLRPPEEASATAQSSGPSAVGGNTASMSSSRSKMTTSG
ncbi:penicillin acylase family protein [Georgenia yuyongxinii]|uniref:Penicillin acylase family protein n=1 Tax=Georgenia yuyongxinii TaxID=2589797 RepID=A0A5B8C6W0_9MICO|nr:penicillin acylase family protein [Georgenia yuyongxinii]QDC26489.1 penicillin acylase family protein [Georgenia yuyongxinii]